MDAPMTPAPALPAPPPALDPLDRVFTYNAQFPPSGYLVAVRESDGTKTATVTRSNAAILDGQPMVFVTGRGKAVHLDDLIVSPLIEGLAYQTNYLTTHQHDWLLATLNGQEWRPDLKRRTQHYGWVYDYKRRTVTRDMYLGPLPEFLDRLATKLVVDGWMTVKPDQVIVNEYAPGQGIGLHVDCEPCFGEQVVSLSLESNCVMNFEEVEGEGKHQVYLMRRSILRIEGAARHRWRHGIAAVKTEQFNEHTIKRQRRVSVTFRNVIAPED